MPRSGTNSAYSSKLAKYLLKRALYFLILLLCVSFLIFAVTDPLIGRAAAVTPRGGMSYFMRYGVWLRAILFGRTGDLSRQGRSLFTHFGTLIPGTIKLAGASLAMIVIVSFPLGLLAALKKDSLFDYGLRSLSFLFVSIPNFSLGFLLIYFFAVKMRWFSVIGDGGPRSLVLPVCALSIPLIARYVRQIRATILEELHQEYVAGAIARGLRPWRVVFLHILPNAMPGILTYLGISIGNLINAVAVIETVFIWRGVGAIAVLSIRTLDYPMIQAYVLWMALLYIVSNLIIDTINHLSAPQRRPREAT